MPDAAAFQRLQYELTAHIRDPEHNPAPAGVEDRRLAIYRELMFNNISDLLGRSFPVIRKMLGDERWRELVRDYFSRHQAHTPLFLEMPREFLAYLESEREEHAEDPPFLLELAHYEWVELALTIDESEWDDASIDPNGDLLDGVPALSPLAWSLSYRWPVHRIGPDFQPVQPDPARTFLLVYRDRDDSVNFIENNAVTARLLDLLGEEERSSGRELLARIAGEMSHPEPETVIRGGLEILRELRQRNIVLGTRR